MSADSKQVVLITGCSSGIGRALTEEFASRGHFVFATARRPESIEDLASDSIDTLALDVNDADSVRSAIEHCVKKQGRIDILINNAGFGLMGPVAEIDLNDMRRQFETNVIGAVAMIQAVTPVLAKQKSGRIVNIGSVSGILATPYSGAYCASKAALHQLTDSLRLELAPFGIQVILVQPGGIQSSFGQNAASGLERYQTEDSLYKKAAQHIAQRASISQDAATPVDVFARKTVSAILQPSPPAIFRMGRNAVKMPLIKKILPVSVTDRILSKKFNLDDLAR